MPGNFYGNGKYHQGYKMMALSHLSNSSSGFHKLKKYAKASGHLDVALTQIGQVLFHMPPDPDGLWITRVAAEALNQDDADAMRNGFYTGAPEFQRDTLHRSRRRARKRTGYSISEESRGHRKRRTLSLH